MPAWTRRMWPGSRRRCARRDHARDAADGGGHGGGAAGGAGVAVRAEMGRGCWVLTPGRRCRVGWRRIGSGMAARRCPPKHPRAHERSRRPWAHIRDVDCRLRRLDEHLHRMTGSSQGGSALISPYRRDPGLQFACLSKAPSSRRLQPQAALTFRRRGLITSRVSPPTRSVQAVAPRKEPDSEERSGSHNQPHSPPPKSTPTASRQTA